MLDEQMAAVGKIGAGCLPLPPQITDQLVGSPSVQEIVVEELITQGRVVEAVVDALQKQEDLLREVEIPAHVLRLPEGKDAGFGLGRDHLHVVGSDLPDAPDMRPQAEGVSDAPLPDELLVELADLGSDSSIRRS